MSQRTSFRLLVTLWASVLIACAPGSDSPWCFEGQCDGRSGEANAAPVTGDDLLDIAGPQWTADWTLLVFAANDDHNKNLVAAFDEDLEELQHEVGGNSLFRILVQRDYAKHQIYPSGHPEQGQSKQSERFGFYRERRFDPETLALASPVRCNCNDGEVFDTGLAHCQIDGTGWCSDSQSLCLEQCAAHMGVQGAEDGRSGTVMLQETDTTDPQVLEDFLVAGIRRFPSKRYWVVITGHGDGWNGLALDATTGSGQRLPLLGLHQALARANEVIAQEVRGPNAPAELQRVYVEGQREQLSDKIDVLQLDVCKLGAVEAATTLADVTDFMIASQEVVPNAGHPYSALRALAQNHSATRPVNVVQEMVVDFVRAYVEGLSTKDRAYVGTTVSSVGLQLAQHPLFDPGDVPPAPVPTLSPLLSAIAEFVDAVRNDATIYRPDGFDCDEVFSIAKAATARSRAADVSQVGRSIRRDLDVTQAEAELEGGRGSVATSGAVDMISLFETLAGNDLLAGRLPANCPVNWALAPPEPANVDLSPVVRQAAMKVLDVIGRPLIYSAFAPCGGSQLEFDGQYRKIANHKSSAVSPFVIEAHRVQSIDGNSVDKRAAGISIYFGDPYDLLLKERRVDGSITDALQTYQSLAFDQLTGWTGVMGACVARAQACRNWNPNLGTPNPCQ